MTGSSTQMWNCKKLLLRLSAKEIRFYALRKDPLALGLKICFWFRQEPKESQCLSVRLSVRPFGDKLSKSVNLHHSGSDK